MFGIRKRDKDGYATSTGPEADLCTSLLLFCGMVGFELVRKTAPKRQQHLLLSANVRGQLGLRSYASHTGNLSYVEVHDHNLNL